MSYFKGNQYVTMWRKKIRAWFARKLFSRLFVRIDRFVFKTASVAGALTLGGWLVFGGVQVERMNAKPQIVRAEVKVEVPAEQKLSDFPILVRICNAESGGKQFKKNGDVVRGAVNPSDIGICQINEYINNDDARRLGYDIFTEKGNVQMAIWLFVNRGTSPWNSSKCIKNGWGTAAECKK